MYEFFKAFCEGIGSNEIVFINKKMDKTIKNYTFFHVTRKLTFDLDQNIFQNYQSSNLVIIEYYNKSSEVQNDQYFFVLFKKYILMIEQSSIYFLQTLFSLNDSQTFCFLSNSKYIFDSKIKIQYKEIQHHLNIDAEVDSMILYLSYGGNKTNLFWKICKRCFCYYFIHQGYLKSNQTRKGIFFHSTNFNNSRIIEEDEYLMLMRIGIGSESQAYLIYHIEREELMVLKMPINASSEDNSKLYEREISNYSKLNHPFLPQFYGVVKDKKYIVIEYIDGNTLCNTKELKFNEKIEIIFGLMLVLYYLHSNYFIYRDLKIDNIMIDNNKTIVLIDFDRLIQYSNISETVDFSSEFIAPEVNTGYFSNQCDVYSLGKIIYYIININSKDMTLNDLLKQYPIFKKIYSSCINTDPKKRPLLIEIMYMFYSEFQSYIPNYMNSIMAKTIVLTTDEYIFSLIKIPELSEDLKQTQFVILKSIIKLAVYMFDSKLLVKLGNFFEKLTKVSKDFYGYKTIDIAINLYKLAFNLNNIYACYRLAKIYSTGKYVEMDINKAHYYYNIAAKQRNLLENNSLDNDTYNITDEINENSLLFCLGVLLLTSKNMNEVDHRIEKGIKYITYSANKDCVYSQNYLGKMYLYGKYVESNIQKAIYYLSLAANKKFRESQYELGVIYFYYYKDIDNALIYMKLSADQDFLKAQTFLGVIYFDEIYIPRDIKRSYYYLLKSASKNDPYSQFYLGCIYSDKKLSFFDIDKAIYYFNLSADQNNTQSMIKLASIYMEKEYGLKDVQKSISYLTKAANLNSIQALNILGNIYCIGYNVPKDIHKSIYYLSLAKDRKNPESSYYLGVIYENGKYINPNIKKAIEYYLFAAELNYPNAQLNLGYIFLEGKKIKRDIEKAIHYFELAANNFNVEAQYNLGLLYEKGEYVQQDMKKSIFYYELAAYRNDGPAQYKLGYFYIDGKYVQRNIKKGFNFLLLSSEKGFTPAHFMVGFLYHEGKFVERDINKAIHYYKKASSLNNQYALNNLGIIYKNGFKDKIEKNISFAIEYFNDAIYKKDDVLSTYNLANVYLYDNQSIVNENAMKSIDLLINSLDQNFHSSQELLLIALIKQFGFDFEKYKQMLQKFGEKIDEVLNTFICSAYANELNDPSNFKISYEYYRNVDFLYNYKKEAIPSESISDSNTNSNASSQRKNINRDFYDGFGLDI